MPLTPEKLCLRLAEEGESTLAFFTGLPEDVLDTRIYTDGDHWSITQIIRHLVQAEKAIQRLMASILAGSPGAPEDFDLDGYNERKVREIEVMTTPGLLAEFSATRARTVAWVAERTPEDLARTGRHPFLGVAPIEEMVKLLYRHTQLHRRDIRRTLDDMD
ncbi:MAG TPA: DinB family protein [Anaerolineales bacterium]|nr:DinB family protein [Anaerolineales bacterium]